MKKLVLFAAVLALGFTSCSKDDDDNGAELAGKWEYSEDGISVLGQEIFTPYEHTTGCAKDYRVFDATTSIDHEFYGSTCQEGIDTNTYTRTGNKIVMTVDGQVSTEEIVQLSNSTLKLKETMTEGGQTIVLYTVYKRK